ncbi:hypothetical protein IEQ11_16030 [Lysobacter capsici]|uniref:hypothetical protein n=1 Tax=Lysobacter capsici TaxID=435897 RepID=UPI001784650F|nr:hypothetical protein [Lysobacter capsici]UOF13252.1 hypothetical protein IEQ11_16030 [Lysobacter capsici]
MHRYSELAMRCAALTQGNLQEAREHILRELQTSGATMLVKALQAIELQQAMVAVGMVAMFDAAIQDALQCPDGFVAGMKIIEGAGDMDLARKFDNLRLAINVLKHGVGRSHDALLLRQSELPFRVGVPGVAFDEGDVSEVNTLVLADGAFLDYCAEVVIEVAELINRERPMTFL